MNLLHLVIDSDDGSQTVVDGPVTVTVTRPPGPPAGVTASAAGTAVTVAWLPPDDDGGLPLDGYTVTLTQAGDGLLLQATSAHTATFTGLGPGSWTATVTAHNQRGASVASLPSAPAVIAPPPPPAAELLVGTNVYASGKTYVQALADADTAYGRLDITRVFYSGMPVAWPGNAGVSGRPVVVSFKTSPANVLNGSQDKALAAWFAGAPKDRKVWWSYYHEPEDNIAAGEFTAADYRTAWQRIAGLADKAGNTALQATLILMGWTLAAGSGRNWKDYHPGDCIDVLGWDVYNGGAAKGTYLPPDQLLAPARDVSAAAGKPWGVAELGSLLVAGDDGTRRAQWLKDCVTWMRANQTAFVTYFDAPVAGEYRLLDAPSKAAWRWAVSG